MATPTKFNSVVTNPGGTGTTITPTLSTHAAGDEIEIFVSKTGNAAWSAPAGWTIRHQTISPGTSTTATVGTLLYRRVLPGDSLPLPSPVCNLGATVTRHAICRTIRGADVEGVYTLPEWSATTTTSGTANPIRPLSVTTPAPEMFVTHYYCQRVATNAPEPTGYTQDREVITSGTLVTNVSERDVADPRTVLANQDVSPTSGGRWVGMISCVPSPDYVYYRSGSQQLTAAGTSATPTLPTGTSASDNRANKDLIIATIECAGTPTISPNTPADWTTISDWSITTSGNGTTIRKYYTFYDGSLDRQFNRSTSGEIFVYFSVYRNVHQSSPLGGTSVQQNTSSTSSAWPALTRTATKATIQATCVADGTQTFTAPSGWTERNDSNGVTCADQLHNATGTVASGSFTLSAVSPTAAGLLEVVSVASQVATVPITANLSLTSFAPVLIIKVTPATAALAVTAFAPSLATSNILTDNFDDNSRDTAKWALGSIAFENASVGVAEANQRVEITPLANTVSPAIYGYKSANNYDFTGQQARVRIATSIASDVEAWLVVVLDANNYLRIWVAGGVLQTRSRATSTNANQNHGTYDFATQNHWRIRHDSNSDEIVFEVGSGTNWTELRRIARPITITSMSVYLSGGTGGSVANPALVTFDDFALNTLTLLIPATATLTTAAFVTALVTKITPTPASLSLATFAPVVSGDETVVVPGTAALTAIRFAPSLRTVITPATTPLTLASFGPSLRVTTTPTAASLVTTGFAPAIVEREIATLATASLTTSTFAPTLTRRETATPSAVSLSVAGFAPVLSETVTPASSNLVLTAFTPTIDISNDVAVVPSTTPLTLTAHTPSLHLTTTPATATVTLTGFAPRLVESAIPTTAALTLSTFAPALTTRRLIIPAPASLTLASAAPVLHETITPNAATLPLTSFAPVVTAGGNISIVPTTGVVTIASTAPSLQLRLTPAAQALTLQSFAPALTESVTVIPTRTTLTLTPTAPLLRHPVTPATASLTLTTLEPIVSVGGTVQVVSPATVSLTLTTFIPTLREHRTPARRMFMVNSEQRTVLVPRETRQYKVETSDREQVAR